MCAESQTPRFIIVGLGNIGSQYQLTRHNIGFAVVDSLASRAGIDFQAGRGDFYLATNASSGSTTLPWWRRLFATSSPDSATDTSDDSSSGSETASETMILVKPTTLMNRSGRAVRQICEIYGVTPKRVLIVTDDLNLPLGAVRLRAGGSDGGHNGLRSIISELETDDFPRLRIGIGSPPSKDIPSFVLSRFASEEQSLVDSGVLRAVETCEWLLRSNSPNSLDIAASKYNIS